LAFNFSLDSQASQRDKYCEANDLNLDLGNCISCSVHEFLVYKRKYSTSYPTMEFKEQVLWQFTNQFKQRLFPYTSMVQDFL